MAKKTGIPDIPATKDLFNIHFQFATEDSNPRMEQ